MTDLSKLLGPSWMSLEDTLSNAYRPFQDPNYMAGIRSLLETQSATANAARQLVEHTGPTIDALRQIHEGDGSALHAAQRAMDAIDLRGVRAASEEMRQAMRQAMLPYSNTLALDGGMSDLARASHWTSALSAVTQPELGALFSASDRLQSQLSELHDVSSRMQEFMRGHQMAVEAATHRLSYIGGLDTTVLKLSAFSGASDLFRPGSLLGGAAFDSLFGRYRTSIDLPDEFWRRREVRREVYEDAGVDPGLIEAENDQVVEILIGGGVATQVDGRNGRVAALVNFGQFEMRVTSARTRHDAFAIVDAFEVSLREFISRKMKAWVGSTWFMQRAHGDTVKRVKDRRRDALRNGEKQASLIDFTDLGDLLEIIVRGDNWDQVFSSTFQHMDRLKVDLQRMIAMRRPTAHARSIDPVRLVEIVCVARRLQDAMDYDQPLDSGWDDDE